jgi:1,4-alpha-glucan branching enzyme
LWQGDPDPESFAWIDCSDRENSVVSYVRRHRDDHVVIVLNFTPVPRSSYRIGVPLPGRWRERLSTDDPEFGGSEFQTRAIVDTLPEPIHGRKQSIELDLPPLGALVLVPER